MAAFTLKYVVTAVGANSVTLTPQVGTNSSGPVTGTLPAGYQDLVGQHSTLVFNFTGTPDSKVFPGVGRIVTVDVEADSNS
jgi:hypothetical protein